jgi:CBS domain-containing protein
MLGGIMRVSDVMTSDVVTLTPSSTLKEAADTFLAHGISGLPVVDGRRVVGVLSESDIVAKETSGYSNGDVAAGEAQHLRREREARTVGEAMTASPVTIEAWVSVWAAADLMTVHDVNRLPVVDRGGLLVGIVTRDDLVRAFARSDEAIAREIRERLLPSVGLTANALEIGVEQGVASVTGTIESDTARECLRASVHLVPGVVRVDWKVEGATVCV